MATSTVAIGKVKLAVYNDKPMPAGWLVDDQGRTVTDPTLAFDGHGRLQPGYGVTPLGGLPELSSYKGYGLGAMVEILGSMLTGAPCIGMLEDRNDHQTGHFFLALDPTAFRGQGDFEAELDGMIDMLHDLEPIDAARPVLVAGEPEDIAYADRLANGIPIPQMLRESLRGICADRARVRLRCCDDPNKRNAGRR